MASSCASSMNPRSMNFWPSCFVFASMCENLFFGGAGFLAGGVGCLPAGGFAPPCGGFGVPPVGVGLGCWPFVWPVGFGVGPVGFWAGLLPVGLGFFGSFGGVAIMVSACVGG